jgi:anti-sigma factor (TIGR02949 family)
MHCKRVRDFLERYADGSLAASAWSDIERHLQACPQCRQDYGLHAQTRAVFRSAELPPPPANLTDVILSRVQAAIPCARPASRETWIALRWWGELTIPVRLAGIGMLVVMMTAGVFMGRDLGRRPLPEAAATATFVELDAFVTAPQGSLESLCFQLTATPADGVDK